MSEVTNFDIIQFRILIDLLLQLEAAKSAKETAVLDAALKQAEKSRAKKEHLLLQEINKVYILIVMNVFLRYYKCCNGL